MANVGKEKRSSTRSQWYMSHGLFVCAVCLENMRGKKPRGLVCFHSLCEACLNGIVTNSQSNIIHCPSCRVKTEVPAGDVTKLPLNFYLDALHDSPPLTKTDICTICKNDNKYTEAVAHCEDCGVYLCLVCRNVHFNHPILLKHKLKSLKHEANDICLIHRKPLKYVCGKCNYDICAECVHTKAHIDHPEDIIDIQERMEEDSQDMKTNVEACLKMLEHKKSYLQHMLASVSYMEDAVTSRVTLVTEELNQAAQSIKNDLQERRNNVESKSKRIENIKSNMSKALDEYNHCRETYGQSCYTELIHAKSSVENKIKEAKDFCFTSVSNVKFIPVENKYNGLGRIISVKEDMIDMFSYQVDPSLIANKDSGIDTSGEQADKKASIDSLDDLNEEDERRETSEGSIVLHASFTPPMRQTGSSRSQHRANRDNKKNKHNLSDC